MLFMTTCQFRYPFAFFIPVKSDYGLFHESPASQLIKELLFFNRARPFRQLPVRSIARVSIPAMDDAEVFKAGRIQVFCTIM